jgi:hypothetical protein
MIIIDPDGRGPGDDDDGNVLQRFLSSLGQLFKSSKGSEDQNVEQVQDENQGNTDEMVPIKRTSEVSEEVLEKVENGVEEVHDVAANVSGGAAILALASTVTPAQPVFGVCSSFAGGVAATASGVNSLLTGDSEYSDRFIYEVTTLGIGAGSSAIKAGKTLTPENVEVLKHVFSNFVTGSSWGGGFIFK